MVEDYLHFFERDRNRNICLFALFSYPFTLSPVVREHDEVIKQTNETNAAGP